MNKSEQHPDSVVLDQLRAGLLDDASLQKKDIEQHLQHCDRCRRVYAWPDSLHAARPELDGRLDALRATATATRPIRRLRRFVPLAAAAALALLAVALINLQPAPKNAGPRVADRGQTEPDLYEDLDFYLWLAEHRRSGDSST